MWYAFLQFWARILFSVFFRIRVFGRENVPPDGGIIFASNHQSFLDPPLVGVGLNRQVHYMARKSLFGHLRLFTWLIESLNAFPVARDRGDVTAVRETLRRLKRGAAILVFPEATRTYKGEIRAFRPGLFALAGRWGVPVVPTAIEGAYESWPRTRSFPMPARVMVGFGRPLLPAEYGNDPERMRHACRESVIELRRQLLEYKGRSSG